MPKESARLMGRNGDIWREYCQGATQEELALKYGKAQSVISDAIRHVRDSIPQVERQDLIKEMVDYFRSLRVTVMEIAAMPAPPVTAGKDGDLVLDPDTGKHVRDYSTRINAIRTAVTIADREIDILGLKGEQKVRISEGEEQASQKLAADALSHLHGGTENEGE